MTCDLWNGRIGQRSTGGSPFCACPRMIPGLLSLQNHSRTFHTAEIRKIGESSPRTRNDALFSSRLAKGNRPYPLRVLSWEETKNPQHVIDRHGVYESRHGWFDQNTEAAALYKDRVAEPSPNAHEGHSTNRE